jgi:hypothetical protein
MVEMRRTPEKPFWTNISAENIITELMATPKGAGIDQISADMEQIINKNGLRNYQRLFMDGSLIGNKVACALRNRHDSKEHQNKTCRTDNNIQC